MLSYFATVIYCLLLFQIIINNIINIILEKMFTCSICDETFAGIHQDSTYTTRCGHVFHYHCLIEWLNR